MDSSRSRTTDPEEWLETAPDFSRAVATELRECIFQWEPDLRESIKWNNLCYSGRKLVVGLSACQRHLAIFFFRGTELADSARRFTEGSENNTNVRFIRFTALDGLNRSALHTMLRAAAGFARLWVSFQREYLVWVSTAKREETREKHLAQTLAALASGRKKIDRK